MSAFGGIPYIVPDRFKKCPVLLNNFGVLFPRIRPEKHRGNPVRERLACRDVRFLTQKQTLGKARLMSALPPKADIANLFDYLGGRRGAAGEQ